MALSQLFSKKTQDDQDPIVGYVQRQRAKQSWKNPRDYVDRTNELELRKQREREEQELALKHVTKNIGKSSEPLESEKKQNFFSKLFSFKNTTSKTEVIEKDSESDRVDPAEVAKVTQSSPVSHESVEPKSEFSTDLYSLEKKQKQTSKKQIFGFGEYLDQRKSQKKSYFAERRVESDLRARNKK